MDNNIDFLYAQLYLKRAKQKQKEAQILLDMAQYHYDEFKKELEKKES